MSRNDAPKLTPLKTWSDDSGLGYRRAYHLATNGHINAVQLGERWYVVGTGLPDGSGVSDAGEIKKE